MSNLAQRMMSAGSVKTSSLLSESTYFNAKDMIPTDLPVLNIAFSGELDGGLVSGLTIFAGESKSFKTLLALYCLRAYFKQYPDSVCLFYDSEFGVTPEYLQSNDIDPARVIHIPIEHVEQLKFDVVKRLEEIKRGDKVFVLVDSLGALASKKEVDDATDEKSVADMSRAKAIRSLLRIITPHLTMKDLPCIIINHVYQTQEIYSKTVIPGGTAVTYSANQIFVITKSQEKDGTEIVGYHFKITVEKSRFVREKSKVSFLVRFDGGIDQYSGLLDLAIEAKLIQRSGAWYKKIDPTSGEISGSMRAADMDSVFWKNIITTDVFKQYVKSRYKLSSYSQATTIEEELSEV